VLENYLLPWWFFAKIVHARFGRSESSPSLHFRHLPSHSIPFRLDSGAQTNNQESQFPKVCHNIIILIICPPPLSLICSSMSFACSSIPPFSHHINHVKLTTTQNKCKIVLTTNRYKIKNNLLIQHLHPLGT
jgi:hypothetical protein